MKDDGGHVLGLYADKLMKFIISFLFFLCVFQPVIVISTPVVVVLTRAYTPSLEKLAAGCA